MGPLEIAKLNALLDEENFIPQAVIGADIDAVLSQVGADVENGADDLDEYTGAGFRLGSIPFAVMRYEGHPPGTSTIYLPRRFSDVAEITETIDLITTSLGVPAAEIIWQRRDDPSL